MDFTDLIKDQNSKISNANSYLDIIWAHVNKKCDYNLETPSIERTAFLEHLPVNLQLFLNDCIQKLQEAIDNANSTINFTDIKTKYLQSLLYWCLVCGEEQNQLVPLIAARLYFMLNTVHQPKERHLLVENLYCAALNAIEAAVSCENIPTQTEVVVDALREFLKKSSLAKDATVKTVAVLSKIIIDVDSRILNQFNSDESSDNLQHAALLCFKVLLLHLQDNYEKKKETVLLTLFNLMGCFSSLRLKRKSKEYISALQYNVKHLLKDIYKGNTVTDCPVLIVIKTLAVHKDFDYYDELVSIISDLDYSVYTNFCWWVAEGIISNQQSFRMILPNTVMPLIIHTHNNLKQEKKNALVEVLILNLIKLCGDSKLDIAENALRNLEMVILLNDNSVKNAVKNLITEEHEAILEMISKHIDKKWKHKSTNRHFINVICKFCTFKRNILSDKLMKEIEEMLSEACPMDMRPCINNLADLLKTNSNQPHVANIILRFFVRMALSPVGLSNFYCKVLYDVLFQSIEQNLDSSNSLNLADLLISQHYEYKEVFKKFQSLNLLVPHKLRVLINYKIQENAVALKLICAMFEHIQYNHFEGLANIALLTFQQKTYCNADMLFYVLEKILTKLARPIHPEDSQFLEELLPCLESEIRIKNLPVSCSTNAIGLLLKLEKVMKRNLQIHHIVTELETSLFNKLMKIEACEEIEMFEVCRDLSYLGDFLLLSDESLGERTVSLLQNVLNINNDRAMSYLSNRPEVWSLLILFFSKLSLKNETFVEQNLLVLESAFVSENENVRYHALLALQDLCSFRLNYFQPLVPHVFKIIREDKASFLIIVCVRIINKLINEDYILLDEQQYVTLTSLLAHKNEYIRMKTENILLESFLLKCNKTITKFFVPSILYYNKYKHHPIIYISEDILTSTTLSMAERQRIYKFLLNSMAINSQFNIISEISSEILAKILDGILIHCAAVLADTVNIISLFLHNLGEDSQDKIEEKLLKAIVEKKKNTNMATRYYDFQVVIKKFLINLLNVTFQICLVDSSLRPELIKIVMRVAKVLFAEINKIIMEGSKDLHKLFSKFLLYYEKYKHTLKDDDLDIVVEFDAAGPSTSFS